MNKEMLGKILFILGVVLTAINVIFFKNNDYQSIIRRSSLAIIFIGLMMIPNYRAPKDTKQEKK